MALSVFAFCESPCCLCLDSGVCTLYHYSPVQWIALVATAFRTTGRVYLLSRVDKGLSDTVSEPFNTSGDTLMRVIGK